jgi:hypothetical protein
MANKKTSPDDGTRACLCKDSTYSRACCKGEEINQGIGALVQQSSSTIVNNNEARTIVRVS